MLPRSSRAFTRGDYAEQGKSYVSVRFFERFYARLPVFDANSGQCNGNGDWRYVERTSRDSMDLQDVYRCCVAATVVSMVW